MIEEWRNWIPGYMLSSQGHVKRCKTWIPHSRKQNSGYYLSEHILKLSKSGTVSIHDKTYQIDEELVKLFLRPLMPTEYIEHVDGDTCNMAIDNLRIRDLADSAFEWRCIPNFQDRYLVNNHGDVIRCRHINKGVLYKAMKMKPKEDSDGYQRVSLTSPVTGRSREWGLHQLVAQAFIPNPENKPTVNHIDGDKHNNSVSNLEWASVQEQNIHAIASGLREGTMKAARAVSKAKISRPVRCIELNRVFSSCIEAERQLNLGSTAVYYSIHRNRPTVQGYTFEYVSIEN